MKVKAKATISKLQRMGVSRRVAQKLTKAGIHTPKQIKQASDEELLAIPSMKVEDVADLRERFKI